MEYKHKYLRRTGSSGHYQYSYRDILQKDPSQMSAEELEAMQERMDSADKPSYTARDLDSAKRWLATKPHLRARFGKRYYEFAVEVAKAFYRGDDPEDIDWASLDNSSDISLQESRQAIAMAEMKSRHLTANQEKEIERLIDQAIKDAGVDRPFTDTLVKRAYQKGLDRGEIMFGMNFIPNKRAVRAIQDYTFDLVKGLNDDMRSTLRQELKRALLNDLGPLAVAEQLRTKLGIFQARARAIARTELNRAENWGHLQAGTEAEKAGVQVLKEWNNPAPDSKECHEMAGQRVGLREKFKLHDGREFDAPPAHPNCRSRLLVVQVTE